MSNDSPDLEKLLRKMDRSPDVQLSQDIILNSKERCDFIKSYFGKIVTIETLRYSVTGLLNDWLSLTNPCSLTYLQDKNVKMMCYKIKYLTLQNNNNNDSDYPIFSAPSHSYGPIEMKNKYLIENWLENWLIKRKLRSLGLKSETTIIYHF